ncbi:RlpA-like protein, double-psi beta-barrel domain [Sesbania bispinosa]|nr:RlpA-like protein, double-psi beta-barrel domain [Sesbania bispinosa]
MELSFKHQLGLVCVILFFPALSNCQEYFTASRATYYAAPDGSGTPRGACGFGDCGKTLNNGSVTAVSAKLWKSGGGCGACYQVKCKIPQYCDDNGTIVLVTDQGEGDRTDFIMSQRGFSKLGRDSASSEELFKYGVVDVEYKRVPCTFKSDSIIVFQIYESSSNPGYFSIVILYIGGIYDLTAVKLWQSDHHQWEPLNRSYGAVFAFSNPPRGDIQLRFELSSSAGLMHASFTVESSWQAGELYATKIQPN